MLVLGIIRNDEPYIGVPRGRDLIKESDRLVIYGRSDHILSLSKRRDKLSGKQEHQESVEELVERQNAEEPKENA